MSQNPLQMTAPLGEGNPRMPEDLAALVADHPLLAGLPGDMAALVTGCAHNVAVKQGEFLLVEGEAADTLYLLRRGCVTLQTHAPGRPPIVIETLEPGRRSGGRGCSPLSLAVRRACCRTSRGDRGGRPLPSLEGGGRPSLRLRADEEVRLGNAGSPGCHTITHLGTLWEDGVVKRR